MEYSFEKGVDHYGNKLAISLGNVSSNRDVDLSFDFVCYTTTS